MTRITTIPWRATILGILLFCTVSHTIEAFHKGNVAPSQGFPLQATMPLIDESWLSLEVGNAEENGSVLQPTVAFSQLTARVGSERMCWVSPWTAYSECTASCEGKHARHRIVVFTDDCGEMPHLWEKGDCGFSCATGGAGPRTPESAPPGGSNTAIYASVGVGVAVLGTALAFALKKFKTFRSSNLEHADSQSMTGAENAEESADMDETDVKVEVKDSFWDDTVNQPIY